MLRNAASVDRCTRDAVIFISGLHGREEHIAALSAVLVVQHANGRATGTRSEDGDVSHGNSAITNTSNLLCR